jgi:hypothetical protein
MPASTTAAPSYSFPPTVSANLITELFLSDSALSQPPPLNVSFVAPQFVLLPVAAAAHDQSTYRQVQEVTITGPLVQPYVVGLLIVPFIMLGILALWGFSLCVADCCSSVSCYTGARRQRAFCQACCPSLAAPNQQQPKRMKMCFFLLLIIAYAAWIAALVYSVLLRESETNVANTMLFLNSTFVNASQASLGLNHALLTLSSSLTALQNQKCVPPASAPVIAQLQTTLKSAANLILQYPVAFLPSLASTTASFASVVLEVSVIRTSCTVVGLALLIILNSLFFLACCGDNLQQQQEQQQATAFPQQPNARPKRVGSCLFLLFLMLLLVFAWIYAAFAHVMRLATSDLCTPNFNLNLVNVVGQAVGYGPAASYDTTAPGASSAQVCELIANDNGPVPLQALCFYQKCNSSVDGATSNAWTQGLNTTYYALIAAGQTLELVNSTLNASSPALQRTCAPLVGNAFVAASIAFVQTAWVLYLLSCENINGAYVSLAYDQLCDAGMYSATSFFVAVIIGCASTMLALMLYACLGLAGGSVVPASTVKPPPPQPTTTSSASSFPMRPEPSAPPSTFQIKRDDDLELI